MDPLPPQLHDPEDHQHNDVAPVVKRKVHVFYLVKLHPYEDPELESRIKVAQGVLTTTFESRAPIVEEFEFRKMDRHKLESQCLYRHRNWRVEEWPWNRYRKGQILDLLQQDLRKLSFHDDREKQVKELRRQLAHDQGPGKVRERNIINQLNHLLRTKELFDRSWTEEHAKIIERWGSKDEIIQRIEGLQVRESIRKEEDREFECLQQRKAAIDKDLETLEGKVSDVNKKRAKAHQCIVDSTRLQATIKADYDDYVTTSNAVKELAVNKDILGLKELIIRTNERFMSKWNNEKAFREVYKKRVESSIKNNGDE